MAFSVEQVDHVEVLVRDLEASARWYGRVLGLREIRRWEPHPVMIGAGGTMLALFRADRTASAGVASKSADPLRWRRVAWRTSPEGLEAARAHLEQCEVAFEGPIDHGGAHSLYFCDLDGHPLEITCYDP
ncbi:MAG: VOC family protein [Planctomycetes bacterium]|nr:VOC family protein [Planctomycetota bacterium]